MANGLNTSSGVSRTGVDATQLSDPDLSSASFSRQGVVDRSGEFKGAAEAAGLSSIAGAIEQSGQIALDIDEGFAKAQLEKQVQQFISQTKPEEVVKQQQGLFGEVRGELTELQGSLQAAEDPALALSRSAPEFTEIMNKLQKGEQQGVLTKKEVEIRALEATRQAIARRPGLARELTQHAEQVLNLSGVRHLEEMEDNLDELEAKRAEEARKSILSRATKLRIPFDRLNPDITNLNMRIQEIDQEFNAAEEAEQLAKMTAAEKEEFRAEIIKKAPMAARGLVRKTHDQILPLFEGVTTVEDLAKVMPAIESIVRDAEAMGNSFIAQNEIPEPQAKPIRQQVSSQLKGLVDGLKAWKGGGSVAEYSGNLLNYTSNNQKIAVRERLNVDQFNMIMRFGQTVPGIVLARNPEVSDRIADIGKSLMFGDVTRNLSMAGMESPSAKQARGEEPIIAGKTDLISMLGITMQSSLPRDGASDEERAAANPVMFEQAVKTAAEMLITNPHGVSSEDRFRVLKELAVEFNGPEAGAYLNNATKQTKTELNNLYDQYRIVLANQQNKAIQRAEDAGAKVTPRITKDGRRVFDVTHSNPATQREFSNRLNNGVGARTNELIGAMSTLFGEDRNSTIEIMNLQKSDRTIGGVIQASVGSEDFLEKVVMAESNGDPNAEAKTSSAVGLTQFTTGTWNKMVDKFAPELKQGRTSEEVLELRKDPTLSKQMAAHLAEDNARILRNSDIELTDTNLYLAHLLGAGTATNVLTASADTPLEDVIGQAAIKANSSIMEGKKVKDLLQFASRKMGE